MPNKRSSETTRRAPSRNDPARLRERDFADEIQGKNRLQGDDQSRVRNQRRRKPQVGGATGKPVGKPRGR